MTTSSEPARVDLSRTAAAGGERHLGDAGSHPFWPRAGLRLLDVEPELGRGLDPLEFVAARNHVLVEVQSLPRGRWSAERDERRPLAYLVLEGALVRELSYGGRLSTELLGPQDVLRPWEDPRELGGLPAHARWCVVQPVRLAVLDERYATAAGRWPVLFDELLARALRRARFQTTLLGIASIPHLDDRLLALLRVLADRWGYVRRDGVHLRVRLTHDTLAGLAGAQRPSITTALGRLARLGQVRRTPEGFVVAHEVIAPAHEADSEAAAEPAGGLRAGADDGRSRGRGGRVAVVRPGRRESPLRHVGGARLATA